MSTDGPGAIDRDRLQRLLGDPALSWLLDRARRRMAQDRPLEGPVTLARPTPAQRAAVERLLGRPPSTGTALTVRLDAVDAVLRTSGASSDGLAPAVHALTGPVELAQDARIRAEEAWSEAYRALHPLLDAAAPGSDRRERLDIWADGLLHGGLVRRLAPDPDNARALLARTAAVVAALPADPPLSTAAHAARSAGDAHALDDGTPLSTLTLSAVCALTGFPSGSGAQWRRAAWASAGLLRDDVSSTVLVLGLTGTPALDHHAATGDPAVLTLRQLTRATPPTLPPGTTVHVCEGPSVLTAAADALGEHCPPLVCLQGQPSAAALTLLRHLHTTGCRLRYHGDFDWGGLRIATTLLRHVPWTPWRYTTDDYRTALNHPSLPAARPLSGPPATAPWAPGLAEAMAASGLRVEEELMLDLLMHDLREHPGL